MKLGAALLSLILLSAPAGACLNDRRVLVAENEFRSSYLKEREESSFFARVPAGGWTAVVGGVSLLVGAWVVSSRK